MHIMHVKTWIKHPRRSFNQLPRRSLNLLPRRSLNLLPRRSLNLPLQALQNVKN
jgi:hypothetical protein